MNAETWEHISCVQHLLHHVITALQYRALSHDQSKLRPPEVSIFAEYTPKLRGTTYGSEEYKRFLAEMKPALDHHYAKNSHHPEHFADGINGMDLLDLLEMLADWKAATMRHDDGDLRRSLAINTEGFGIGGRSAAILEKTALSMGGIRPCNANSA